MKPWNNRTLALIAGFSYLAIFFLAIFANFFALESIIQHPLETISQNGQIVRLGVIAFILAAIFDTIVAIAFFHLNPEHPLTLSSFCFRTIHAILMAIGTFAMFMTLHQKTAEDILRMIEIFNTIWLIGLIFFGIHLILLAKILPIPKLISIFLTIAGIVYILDTGLHITLENYKLYEDLFLAMVAIPSIIGEMSLSIWLLWMGGKSSN
ncbi:MAG: DUF4386 domain-containing protein [Leptospiraceae bacterium]|nr:DUF4386 domain-containing protein [Leptospiraceae bacterium]